MAELIYTVIASLDGYVNDEQGNFDWAAPGEEVHAFVNDLERPIGTYLVGRRLYEVMRSWETVNTTGDSSPVSSPVERDYAEIWQGADKVVYSTTLTEISAARTRIERDFDPDVVREMKVSAERDLSVGGPGLAGRAFEAGLVDECRLFVAPVVVGGGTFAYPRGVFARLELVDQRRFANGIVYLRYRMA